MDDLTVEKLDIPTISEIGSFEQALPSYWTKGAEPIGSTLSWATDESRSMGKSLKITKTATSEAAMWESENMCDLWSEKHFENVDIEYGNVLYDIRSKHKPDNGRSEMVCKLFIL